MKKQESLEKELSSPDLKLARTFELIEELDQQIGARQEVTIGISSNISVAMLPVFLRKQALLNSVRLSVETGNYDDTLNDSGHFASSEKKYMVYLPYFDNLMPFFESQIEGLTANELSNFESNFRERSTLIFRAAEAIPWIFVGTFHRHSIADDEGNNNLVDEVMGRFNQILQDLSQQFVNVRLINTSTIVQLLGTEASFDQRFYARNLAPYKAAFLDEFARRVSLASRGFGTYFFKALVLDCDNTLWGGVVGEAQLSGIHLDPHSYPGRVFWQVQHAILNLERYGVLLCLCSKNNMSDVDEVLDKHEYSVLKQDVITVKMVNWSDKVANLQKIANQLNISLDSIIFLDDSAYECEAVRMALPQVRVFQVPSSLPDYPSLLQNIRELFMAGGVAEESRSKTSQYKRIEAAAKEEQSYTSHEEYLSSLEISVSLKMDTVVDVQRISELTNKSNQFNLTTLRMSQAQVLERMNSTTNRVYSFDVSDKFGCAGLTGVISINYEDVTARVEAFLMSCRVIGRGVEYSVWSYILREARQFGCRYVEAKYIPTSKNSLVASFYEELGLDLADTEGDCKSYRLEIEKFISRKPNWIKVTHG